ncbi:family 4 glycosyl hydrolase [Cellulomonas wangsupingiae]|uniref:Alpha-glucosidase/alpha-galactosidase n=1 Tax=Cellulomonas wangsupingiae TaxID=2968085 RepID=A0ABY5KBC9_9CELL|nr:alpha-glucosidase/alpha-galactosidase [Cellulomonas wangsupingiae]MCC2333030.1 alpha-glucosidase/alpha-galactosidase [Cellulomonas wangsupingiae]MCM0640388.1 alpha-glucosidase/alpha-galactosidase [Cellulomonas wangsupingiae]UUI66746.1 alpha-glucosidase/alpha-galactosidase [Cellulomonas wangsupingiae]
MALTVAFVGAQSIEFARDDVADLCARPEIGAVRITLHDPDTDRLAQVRRVAEHVVAGTGARHVEVDARTDLAGALAGARYVVTELEVGGVEATCTDLDVAARFGVRQTAADTIGIGGIFRGLRTVPVGVAVAQEMTRRCPEARLLSYTNPMSTQVRAVADVVPGIEVLGLCHAVRDTHAYLAGLVGLDDDTVDAVSVGANHQTFVLRFEHAGASVYAKVREAVAAGPRTLSAELMDRFGYFPVELGDQPAEYLPWVMRHDAELARLGVRVGTADDVRRAHRSEDEELARAARDGHVPVPRRHPEPATEILHALETGARTRVSVTVPNRGLLPDLPPGSGVEVPCDIAGGQAHPVAVGALPPQVAGLVRGFLTVADLVARAAIESDLAPARQAALLDPATSATLTPGEVDDLFDALLDAHAPSGLYAQYGTDRRPARRTARAT